MASSTYPSKGHEKIALLITNKKMTLDMVLSRLDELLHTVPDPFAAGPKGWTPFIQAIRSDRIELVKYLIEAGHPLDGADDDGWTAVHWAIRSSTETLVMLIRDHG